MNSSSITTQKPRSLITFSSLSPNIEIEDLTKKAQRLELEANLLIPSLRKNVIDDFRSMNQNLSQILAKKFTKEVESESDEDEVNDDEYIASLEAYNMEPAQVDTDEIENIDNFFDYVIALPESKITTAQKILLMTAAQDGNLESKVDYL